MDTTIGVFICFTVLSLLESIFTRYGMIVNFWESYYYGVIIELIFEHNRNSNLVIISQWLHLESSMKKERRKNLEMDLLKIMVV